MTTEKQNKKQSNILGGIWLLVVLLLLLVFASGVLLYSILGSFSDGEYNVIALVPVGEENGELPEPSISEDGETWEFDRSIDLFKTTYTNANGEITVEAANGDKVIAPGTANTFYFSLKNTGNISMDFTMTLEGLFTLHEVGLPFEVRLRSGDTWLVGDEDTWLTPDALESVAVDGTIERGNYINYTLDWRWPYEGDDEQDKQLSDLNDTLIGSEGGTADVNFTLNINTVATITEGALPVNQNGLVMLSELINPWVLYILLALVILAAGGGIVWWVVAKKKKDTNEKA